MTAEQQACEEHFLIHTIQQPAGRFVVRLPTKMEPNQLGTSRLSAERRLRAIERRLERDPELKVQYHSFMKEYEVRSHGTSEIPRGKEHMLLCTTLSSLQGNQFRNKDSSCVRWRCQDSQWIITK
jgi:hypothetical protein